eukprot:CAMPEP_0206292834 /NCGR_PEP_ID=MMETSP0106_2-20121207/3831_1 /ASSEMBLY_ACC=CAM_ASM_000206 /TAXON_ID=81532 /ORGANISM="Acanthoeca-like sp., Strain 10tr" /LENGTH=455 /DNA_ID=CAMNT_0053723421 /DNA_START=180 /DNA_END=1544 /DNA_ORIENTATION=-
MHQLAGLKHHDGSAVVELYCSGGYENSVTQGPIVTFNLRRADGSWVGFAEVERLASLRGIHLRTGCFCNAGACQKYLDIDQTRLEQIVEAGYTCGSTTDVIDGHPVGCVRVSFGYMSTVADADALIAFLSSSFVESAPAPAALVALAMGMPQPAGQADGEALPVPSAAVHLEKIHVFPVKSCGAMEVDAWEIDEMGLRYDRHWMVVNVHGSCISQKQTARLALVRPTVDLKARRLILRAAGVDPLYLPLEQPPPGEGPPTEAAERPARLVRVCNDKVLGDDAGDAAAHWLSRVVGVTPQAQMQRECRVSRAAMREGKRAGKPDPSQPLSLANESQFLLVSEASMEEVNGWAEPPAELPGEESPPPVSVDRFRGNLVIAGGAAFAEDGWGKVRMGTQVFEVMAPCQRCQMVCVDQQTGERTKEPLLALSKFRRHKGATFFGQHLRHCPTESAAPFV